jgi:hypothetical protein
VSPDTARAILRDLILSGADAVSSQLPDNVFGAGLANAQRSVFLARGVCQ